MLKQTFLVKQAKQGNHEAFITLIQGYELVLYNLAYRYLGNEEDVADAIQETTMIAYEKMKQITSPRYFNTWLCKILINQCQKMLKSRHFFYELDNVSMPIEEKATDYLFFEDLLKQLDSRYSIPLMLHYYQGYSVKEIGELLNEPVGTIKSRLSRGRKQLKASEELKGGLCNE